MRLYAGATFAPAEYDEHLTALDHVGVCRVFSQTDQLPLWTDVRVQKLKKAGVVPFLSCALFSPGNLKQALDTMPADIPLAFIAIKHEPETDLPFLTWLSSQRAAYELVIDHPNRDRVGFVGIQTKQWTEAVPGRKYMQWWSGVSDAFAVDCYVDSWGDPVHYPDPKQWLARVIDFAGSVGQPLWLPELGAVSRPGDKKDTGRADWLAGVIAELESSGICELAAWWCAAGTTGKAVPGLGTSRNFHLDERQTDTLTVDLKPAPTMAVWQYFMTRHRSTA